MDQQTLAANGFVPCPSWSLTVGQLGAGFILAGGLLFLISVASSLIGMRHQRLGKWTFVAGASCILGAMGCLASLFLNDQFQFEYVSGHSWHDLSPWYKFAAVWSGQQGSFLLWGCTSAIFGLLSVWRTGKYQRWYVFVYSLFLGSLCGILAYETPFGLIKDLFINGVHLVPPDGIGLNASLQNYWVVVHPPTIFTGFGSLTVPFAFAVSAMLTGDPKEWLARVRPWALVSTSILGLGLVMGGLWAYETQGWGGFWAWDPVENVSFVPWLFGIAFLHGLIVQTTRSRWHGSNLLMGGLPFLLFVYGTFLTRSGFLSKFSNHSFAEMNRSALWILGIFFLLVTAGFVTLWATKGRKLAKAADTPVKQEGFNREKAYQSGVIFLAGLSTTIAIGMSIPFFIGLAGGDAKVVEEPLYHVVVVWFFAPIMALMGAAPFLAWRSMPAREFWSRLMNVLGITIGVVGVALLLLKMSDWSAHATEMPPIDFPLGIHVPRVFWVMCLFGLTTFVGVANVWRLAELFPRSKMGIGSFLAHIGVATTMAGLILSRGLEQKQELILVTQGSAGEGLGYTIAYKDMTSNPNDRNNKVEFDVSSFAGKKVSFVALAGFFYNPGADGEPTAFTWPHIEHELTHDVYLSLRSPVVTLWEKPVKLMPGESKEEDNLSVTYLGPTMHGNPGQPDTSFGAKIRVVENGRTHDSEPLMYVDQREPKFEEASSSFLDMITNMDAKDRSITLQLFYKHPVYPIDLYYKPMTLLVWVGTGIMTLGGLLSAFYRRNRRRLPVSDDVEKDDALVPTP